MGKLTGKQPSLPVATAGSVMQQQNVFWKREQRLLLPGVMKKQWKKLPGVSAIGAHGIVADAGKMKDLDAIREKVEAVSGSVDILFSNAGVGLFAPFEQTTEAIFDANMDINFKGTFSPFRNYCRSSRKVVL